MPPKAFKFRLEQMLEMKRKKEEEEQNKLIMLRRELGKVRLSSLNAVVLRDFIDRRLIGFSRQIHQYPQRIIGVQVQSH